MKRETQKSKVKKHLESGQSITPIDALERYGCFRLAAIIWTLKHEDGMNIKTENVKNKYGTKYGKYTLVNDSCKKENNIFDDEDLSKLELLLKIYGYEKFDIKDDLDGNKRLRIGYWKPLKTEDIAKIHGHCNLRLEEVDWEDDDCGTLYCYEINLPRL
tara:strand:+ start:399 stop:875 length:477 start_codon:yes stop_codon:yes gene_type:complete